MVRISVRVSREVYKALKELVDAGVYSSISEAVRDAIVRLVKEEGTRLVLEETARL